MSMFSNLMDKLFPKKEQTEDAAEEAAEEAVAAGETAVEEAAEAAEGVLEGVAETAAGIGGEAVEAVESAVGSAGEAVAEAGEAVAGAAESAGGHAESVAGEAVEAAREAVSQVDVESMLNDLAEKADEKLDWKVSIVDLLKLLDLDSSYGARKDMAVELGYSEEDIESKGSAEMNMWLHKQVMNKIAENGGKVPEDLIS